MNKMNKMNKCYTTSVLLISGALGLVGCDEQPDPAAKTEVSNLAAPAVSTPPPIIAPAPVVAQPPQPYEATLQEGIDFKKPGFPKFIAEVSGMSGLENWGRWTDGKIVKFKFKQVLSKKFTLEIVANALGPNQGLPIKVRVGTIEQTFTIVNKNPPSTYSLSFETDGKSDTVEITIPKPTAPNEINPENKDTRKIGLGFIALKIKS